MRHRRVEENMKTRIPVVFGAGLLLLWSASAAAGDVALEVERVGLDGHINRDTPVVLQYRIVNQGDAQDVVMGLQIPAPNSSWLPFPPETVAPVTLSLTRGEQRTVEWILPALPDNSMESREEPSKLFLTARDNAGHVVRTLLPPIRTGWSPTVILAANRDDALRLEQAIHQSDLHAGGERRQLAMVFNGFPEIWYEYLAASTVVLARPCTDLSHEQQAALRRWLHAGGHLGILSGYSGDCQSFLPPGKVTPGANISLGDGTVSVAPSANDPEGAQQQWLAHLVQAVPVAPVRIHPPLLLHYEMPDTTMLVGLIIAMILLLGPGIHLLLIYLRRRELVWVVLPAAGIALSVAMYATASRVKGESTALEVHQVVWKQPDVEEASVTTAVRMQSDRVGLRRLEVRGIQPFLGDATAIVQNAIDRTIEYVPRRNGLSLRRIPMHRFSSKDFHFTSPGMLPDVAFNVDDKRIVHIVNSLTTPLEELVLAIDSTFYAIPGKLASGERLDMPLTDRMRIDPTELTDEMTREEWWRRRRLGVIGDRLRETPGEVVLIAGCSDGRLPSVELFPAPAVEYHRTTCVWQQAREEVNDEQ